MAARRVGMGPARALAIAHGDRMSANSLQCMNAPYGTKGRSPLCTPIGRSRREADKPSQGLAAKRATLDPKQSFNNSEITVRDMQTRTVTLIKHPSSRNAVHVTGAVNSLLSRAKHEEVFHNMVAFVGRQCVIADHAVYRVVRRMRFRPHTDSLIFRSAMRAREVFGKIMSIHLAHPVEIMLASQCWNSPKNRQRRRRNE